MQTTMLPYHYVDFLTSPGLNTTAGHVRLDQYLCSTLKNGGNDSAHSLFGNLRAMKDGGTGPTMQALIGRGPIDLALKGQGSGAAFTKIFDFMLRNKKQLKTLRVEACARRKRSDPATKIVTKKGNVYDLYFKDRSDQAALQAMVADRFFGVDCIGFVSGFLRYCGEWPKHKNIAAGQYAAKVCKGFVNDVTEIMELDFLCWDGHVAMVDWIWRIGDGEIEVDVCQSSSGGPQCNQRVILRQTKIFRGERRLFRIAARGTPPMPVDGHCRIGRRAGFSHTWM